MSISDLRQSYEQAPRFDIHEAEPDPIEQFHRWFTDAVNAGIKEPNAMTLATVDDKGYPDARIVLLKDVDGRGFTFYTSYISAKAEQLAQDSPVSLVFYWDVIFRQVRIKGTVTKVSREESQAYWSTRPRNSQLGAIASRQSAEFASRIALEEAFGKTSEKYAQTQVIPLPDCWGGYRISHQSIEFWQGQPSRLHDRLIYTPRKDSGWKIKRLGP